MVAREVRAKRRDTMKAPEGYARAIGTIGAIVCFPAGVTPREQLIEIAEVIEDLVIAQEAARVERQKER